MGDIEHARIAAIRDLCKESIEFDARVDIKGLVPPRHTIDQEGSKALTDRAWLAESVINILDGKIDDQLEEK